MVKKVIAACIEQVIEFDSDAEFDKMTNQLMQRKQDFKIVSSYHNAGKLIVKIRKQYNNNVLLGGE